MIVYQQCDCFRVFKYLHMGRNKIFQSTSSDIIVEVYDHVLAPNSCKAVDNEAKLCGMTHTVYNRDKHNPRSFIEFTIDTILNNLNDTSTNVS